MFKYIRVLLVALCVALSVSVAASSEAATVYPTETIIVVHQSVYDEEAGYMYIWSVEPNVGMMFSTLEGTVYYAHRPTKSLARFEAGETPATVADLADVSLWETKYLLDEDWQRVQLILDRVERGCL